MRELSGNPTFRMLNSDSFSFCLAPYKPSEISCDGATDNIRFPFNIAECDVYINGVLAGNNPTDSSFWATYMILSGGDNYLDLLNTSDKFVRVSIDVKAETAWEYPEDNARNPTFFVDDNGLINFCLAPKQESIEPLGCEGSTSSIEVGSITDGGIYSVYVNDTQVGSGFMFRPNGLAKLLQKLGIEYEAYDSSNNLCIETSQDRFSTVDRVLFKNSTTEYQKIRIESIDANAVSINHTPENGSFAYSNFVTNFCLAPNDECNPTSIEMPEVGLATSGSVYLRYEVNAPNHNINQAQSAYSGVDYEFGTPISNFVDQTLYKIMEEYPFIKFHFDKNEIANFKYWYDLQEKSKFGILGATDEISSDPITIKFIRSNMLGDIFDQLFPNAMDGQVSIHSCGLEKYTSEISCDGATQIVAITGLDGEMALKINDNVHNIASFSDLITLLKSSYSDTLYLDIADELKGIIFTNISDDHLRISIEASSSNLELFEDDTTHNPTAIKSDTGSISVCLAPTILCIGSENVFNISDHNYTFKESDILCLAYKQNGNIDTFEIPVNTLSQYINEAQTEIPYMFLNQIKLRSLTVQETKVSISEQCIDNLCDGSKEIWLDEHAFRSKFDPSYAAYVPNAPKKVSFTLNLGGQKISLNSFISDPNSDTAMLTHAVFNHFKTQLNQIPNISADVVPDNRGKGWYKLILSYTHQSTDSFIVVRGGDTSSNTIDPENHIFYTIGSSGGWGGGDINDFFRGTCSLGSKIIKWIPDGLTKNISVSGQSEIPSPTFNLDPQEFEFNSYQSFGLTLPINGIDWFTIFNQPPIIVTSCGYTSIIDV